MGACGTKEDIPHKVEEDPGMSYIRLSLSFIDLYITIVMSFDLFFMKPEGALSSSDCSSPHKSNSFLFFSFTQTLYVYVQLTSYF